MKGKSNKCSRKTSFYAKNISLHSFASSLLSGSFLYKFSSLSAPTKIEKLTAGSDEKKNTAQPLGSIPGGAALCFFVWSGCQFFYLCRSWKRRQFDCFHFLSQFSSITGKSIKLLAMYWNRRDRTQLKGFCVKFNTLYCVTDDVSFFFFYFFY